MTSASTGGPRDPQQATAAGVAKYDEATTKSPPLPSALHERAATSARETRQAVLTMSSAIIGFFFVAITSKDAAKLYSSEKVFLGTALTTMALTVASALWSAWSDARWAFCWAKVLEEDAKSGAGGWAKQQDYWHRHKRRSEKAFLFLFVAGILAAVGYVILRVS